MEENEPFKKSRVTAHELDQIVDRHRQWLDAKQQKGAKASFVGADLSGPSLSQLELTKADFEQSDLLKCDLDQSNLSDADFSGADLTEARLYGAILNGANFSESFLTSAKMCGASLLGASLKDAWLEKTDLRDVHGLILDETHILNAQFSPVATRWRAWLSRRGISDLPENDPWSILRQLYAGPKAFVLFFFVLAFCLPYVGRAAFYSTVSATEDRVANAWQSKKEHWREPHRAIAGPAAQVVATPFDGTEDWIRHHSQPRPLWQVLLRWDEGRIWPTVLAVILIVYNVGVYWLVSSVTPLRDEEERSGWSPAWKDYGYLVKIHCVVTILFYVSFGAFLLNLGSLLFETVWVPVGS